MYTTWNAPYREPVSFIRYLLVELGAARGMLLYGVLKGILVFGLLIILARGSNTTGKYFAQYAGGLALSFLTAFHVLGYASWYSHISHTPPASIAPMGTALQYGLAVLMALPVYKALLDGATSVTLLAVLTGAIVIVIVIEGLRSQHRLGRFAGYGLLSLFVILGAFGYGVSWGGELNEQMIKHTKIQVDPTERVSGGIWHYNRDVPVFYYTEVYDKLPKWVSSCRIVKKLPEPNDRTEEASCFVSRDNSTYSGFAYRQNTHPRFKQFVNFKLTDEYVDGQSERFVDKTIKNQGASTE